ncbi:MAG: 3-hydroxyacyl-[acyl-carrier protein] dehydratase/trans-2-decenoyl-[acyl-carrier protein] isomerase [Crocinitomicaceae bacterium]|jgi:3-hydroxyacyl-[acyl-carrier protein] dehydratase/trans-2-decenoyl-[acyl-carrier protein] isomerase
MSAVEKMIDLSVESLIEQAGSKQAQLPIDQLRLLKDVPLIDMAGGKYGKGEVIAEMEINPDLWFFKCHFPGDPIMPGCLGLEGLWQTVGLFLFFQGIDGKVRALGVGELKLTGQVLPTVKKLQFHVHIRKLMKRSCSVALADGEVRADGELIYTAKNIKVGIFPDADEPIKPLIGVN